MEGRRYSEEFRYGLALFANQLGDVVVVNKFHNKFRCQIEDARTFRIQLSEHLRAEQQRGVPLRDKGNPFQKQRP